jgi:hypothetical protein
MVVDVGRAAETMGDLERAQKAYERVLQMNSNSWRALTQAAHVCRCREDYPRVSFFFFFIMLLSELVVWLPFSMCPPLATSSRSLAFLIEC